MNFILSGATIFMDGKFQKKDIAVSDGKVVDVTSLNNKPDVVYFVDSYYIFPGFTDVHVHFREPGFSYKETIYTGSKAAAAGGYTAVCTMPNLNPVPDTFEHLKMQTDLIKENAVVSVYPYGSITTEQKGEKLSEMDELSKMAIAFSDDGRGVQSRELMKSAMLKAKELNKIIVAHCEDNSLLNGGYIHDGEYAKVHNHKGICSESEWKPIARDIELLKETGTSYHVCHVSTKESVELIRKAKACGVDITAETAPHYLVMNDSMLQEDGRFKMNPPIRSEQDRLALIDGIKDGTIDMIATDHAPHSAEEKGKGLEKSAMGVVGLETAFSVLYTKFVKDGVLSLEKLISLLHDNPNKRFSIDKEFKFGSSANFTVFNLDECYEVDPEKFQSMGRSTPFKNEKLFGKCKMTVHDGNIVWNDGIKEN